MRQTSEERRPKTTGGARRESPLARGLGGAAPVEAQQAGDLRPRGLEWRQLERWENEGGAVGDSAARRKTH